MDKNLDRDVSELWSTLFDIVSDSEKRLASHFEAHQLTPPQFYVLKTLSENAGECRIGDIARDHHLTSATMTGLVKRLEAMDPPLVRRRRNQNDGRSVDVILTAAGHNCFVSVQRGLMDQLRAVFGLLPDAERRDIIAKVRQYFAVFSQQFPVDRLP
ncbi:MAG: MarR family transcriptional regulator [Chloroflexota bacterium]|nr:MarR family transcriptional regulator [Chloroflexota bacterium]MDE2946548.1 MarR family transcriptional regulator [Chloroflexota bacterium]